MAALKVASGGECKSNASVEPLKTELHNYF
jgi:hypothetical protein